MCARYTLFTPGDLLAERFNLSDLLDLSPRYNVAPSQQVAVVGSKAGGGRGLAMFQWGFVPQWANDARSGPSPVNAKSESIATNSAFRDSFRLRRCLIPNDGFFEWQTTTSGKRPLWFRHKNRDLMAFAGIWDCWRGSTKPLFTCAIITTTCNELVRPIHDRMPVILPPERWEQWLDPSAQSTDAIQPLLCPFPADQMQATPVSTFVNNSRHEGVQCIAEGN